MANPIRVIGIGPGSLEYITPAAMEQIKSVDVLIGGERVLAPFKETGKQTFIIKNNLKEMVEFINEYRNRADIAVLASGDPSFYGILEFLKRHFEKADLFVIPGISSAQLACAKLCISWHDAGFFSVHGRSTDGLLSLVNAKSRVIILTDPVNTPALITKILVLEGLSERKVYVCENLSYEDESITEYELNNIPEHIGASGCIMVISDER